MAENKESRFEVKVFRDGKEIQSYKTDAFILGICNHGSHEVNLVGTPEHGMQLLAEVAIALRIAMEVEHDNEEKGEMEQRIRESHN